MNERIKSLLIYAAKCVTGILIVFTISHLIHYQYYLWAVISVLLVLSPDGMDATKLAMTRIKANGIGAAAGMLCLLIVIPANMWTVSLAISAALTACYALKLDDGIRSALAATIIVMMHEEGKHVWDSALERVIGVMAGCVLGLLISYLFHFNNKQAVR